MKMQIVDEEEPGMETSRSVGGGSLGVKCYVDVVQVSRITSRLFSAFDLS